MKSTKRNRFSRLVSLKADKFCRQSCGNDDVECDISTSKQPLYCEDNISTNVAPGFVDPYLFDSFSEKTLIKDNQCEL